MLFKFIFLSILFVITIFTIKFYSTSILNSQLQTVSEVDSVSSTNEIKVSNLTLEQIFNSDNRKLELLSKDKIRTMLVTGDVLLARSVNFKNVRSNNFIWPFEKTAEVLNQADLTFINLETPLIENCPVTNEGMTFCGDVRNIEGLKFAGIDVINIANNHISNFGLEGVESTEKILTQAGFKISGRNGPTFMDVRGKKFAFLGYNEVNYQEGISLAEKTRVFSDVKMAKNNSDIVIVQFHWGNEYTTQITPNQRSLAHAAIDSGAEVVVGNHPHWIQPIEIYKGKVIAYSHGNFIFDQEWSQKTKEGVVGKYTFYENKLIDVEFLPLRIENYGQPYFLENDRKNEILKEMKKESF